MVCEGGCCGDDTMCKGVSLEDESETERMNIMMAEGAAGLSDEEIDKYLNSPYYSYSLYDRMNITQAVFYNTVLSHPLVFTNEEMFRALYSLYKNMSNTFDDLLETFKEQFAPVHADIAKEQEAVNASI